MSYQVLARKWRPRGFEQVVGQGHVLRALVNALDSDRLHHAYLFTGTRGVGKTSLARVFAKALNCDQGVSAKPCGECASCREVDEARFVDLIEVDAASRTKVDETRDLLDNVQYAPTRGRYKVYLIDEVHMFSTHSFNALLKTLEEPPPHVKFLLATTDPKKLPVTILSRCLQFNLKRVTVEQLGEHLRMIADAEGIPADDASLALIAHAADGSVRDSLSLLDQAIAYGAGELRQVEVAAMLGTIGAGDVAALVEALANNDAAALIGIARELATSAPDYHHVLGEVLSLLRRIAVWQSLGDDAASLDESKDVIELAAGLSPEDCQLFYQIGLIGRRDLALAPDPQSGFEMVLLRMLAFRPLDTTAQTSPPVTPQAKRASTRTSGTHTPDTQPAASPANGLSSEDVTSAAQETLADQPVAAAPPQQQAQEADALGDADNQQPPRATVSKSYAGAENLDWNEVVAQLDLQGFARELARNAALKSFDGSVVELVVAPQHESLTAGGAVPSLEKACKDQLELAVKVNLSVAAGEELDTPSKRLNEAERARQSEAERNIDADPTVQTLQNEFGATIEQVQPK